MYAVSGVSLFTVALCAKKIEREIDYVLVYWCSFLCMM